MSTHRKLLSYFTLKAEDNIIAVGALKIDLH